MFTNDMIYRFYAYQGYNYLFDDQTAVNTAVLSGLSSDLQTQIYTDGIYGMNSVGGLVWWFKACEFGKTSDQWTTLATKFALDEDAMEKIVGSKSMISMIYMNIHNTILSEEGSVDPE
jgi:hypothetical protein